MKKYLVISEVSIHNLNCPFLGLLENVNEDFVNYQKELRNSIHKLHGNGYNFLHNILEIESQSYEIQKALEIVSLKELKRTNNLIPKKYKINDIADFLKSIKDKNTLNRKQYL